MSRAENARIVERAVGELKDAVLPYSYAAPEQMSDSLRRDVAVTASLAGVLEKWLDEDMSLRWEEPILALARAVNGDLS